MAEAKPKKNVVSDDNKKRSANLDELEKQDLVYTKKDLHEQGLQTAMTSSFMKFINFSILNFRTQMPNINRFNEESFDLHDTPPAKRATNTVKSGQTFDDDGTETTEPEEKTSEDKNAEEKPAKKRVASFNLKFKYTLSFMLTRFIHELSKGKASKKISDIAEFEEYIKTLEGESAFSRSIINVVNTSRNSFIIKQLPDFNLHNIISQRIQDTFKGTRDKFGSFIGELLAIYLKQISMIISCEIWNNGAKQLNDKHLTMGILYYDNLARTDNTHTLNRFFEDLTTYLNKMCPAVERLPKVKPDEKTAEPVHEKAAEPVHEKAAEPTNQKDKAAEPVKLNLKKK